MSKTIALESTEAIQGGQPLSTLPPVTDWTVHFSGPGTPSAAIPWDPRSGRVATSGLIFLKGVAERLKVDGEGSVGPDGRRSNEPRTLLMQAGVLRPCVEGRGHALPWIAGGCALAALLVVTGLVFFLGLGGSGTVQARGRSLVAVSVGPASAGSPLAAALTSLDASNDKSAPRGPAVAASLPATPETQPAAPETQPAAPETQPAAPESQLATPETQPAAPESQLAAREPQPAVSGIMAAPAVEPSSNTRREDETVASYRARRRAERRADAQAEAARLAALHALPSAQAALAQLAAMTHPVQPASVKAGTTAAPSAVKAPPATLPVTAPVTVAVTAPGTTPAVKPAPSTAPIPAGLNTMDMLRAAGASQASNKAAAAPALPERLGARVLHARAQGFLGQARSCLRTFGFSREVLSVHLEIAGATGRVARAQVAGRFASMPVGHCLVRAAQGLSFPRFQAQRQTVVLPVTGR